MHVCIYIGLSSNFGVHVCTRACVHVRAYVCGTFLHGFNGKITTAAHRCSTCTYIMNISTAVCKRGQSPSWNPIPFSFSSKQSPVTQGWYTQPVSLLAAPAGVVHSNKLSSCN